MTAFCLQILPDRAPDLDLDRVRQLCRLITARRALAERHSIVEGSDKQRYVNLVFETDQPGALWEMLRSVFYEDVKVGIALKTASMAMCEGESGWDDFRLLHHFDPEIELDTL